MLKMPKQKIVLASASEQENMILKRKLDPIAFDLGSIQYLSVRTQAVHNALDASTSLVILNTATFTPNTRQAITDSRRYGYKGPILVVSKVDMLEAIEELKAMENVVLLQRPYEIRDLQGIVRKSFFARKVTQQVHRRYNTVQKAHVEVEKGTTASTTLFNLSRGGAYFEFAHRADVKVGDVIRMTIELDELNRVYAMPAKVVWTTPMGQSGGHGVGVEFIGRPDARSGQVAA